MARTRRCCKTANETLQGLDALSSKRAPFRTLSCIISQSVQAYPYPLRRNVICAYTRRAMNNARFSTCGSSQKYPHEWALLVTSRYINCCSWLVREFLKLYIESAILLFNVSMSHNLWVGGGGGQSSNTSCKTTRKYTIEETTRMDLNFTHLSYIFPIHFR